MKWLELKIPPPAFFAMFAFAMWRTAILCPFAAFSVPFRMPLAAVLGFLGGGLGAVGVWKFIRARTTIHPNQPEHSAVLVTTGIYRITRNPMYLGLLLMLAGGAVYLANGTAFVFLPGFVLCLNRWQIRPEERILREKFGGKFDEYARVVRRWL